MKTFLELLDEYKHLLNQSKDPYDRLLATWMIELVETSSEKQSIEK